MPGLTCMSGGLPPYAPAEVGGRRCRQPGQVRKEAATTISCRVVGFHLSPRPRVISLPRNQREQPLRSTAMDDLESPALGLDIPEQPPKAPSASPYRVLARKYRPQ